MSLVRGFWDGTRSACKWATDVSLANGNRGPSVFQAGNLAATQSQLDAFLAAGFTACAFQIQYPLLDPTWVDYDAQYLTFYNAAVAYAKSIGLAVLVETSPVFAGTNWSGVVVDYSGMTNAQYLAARQAMCVLIQDQMTPDWLSILHEPETEEYLTEKTFTDSEFENFVIDTVAAIGAGSGTLLGAGVGSWETDLTLFNLLVATDIDWVNIHVYPVVGVVKPLATLLTMAQTAATAGKTIGLGECFLYKESLAESQGAGVAAGQYYFRDVYTEFWRLDSLFIIALSEFCHWQEAEMFTMFWERNFFASLNFTDDLAAMAHDDQIDLLATTAYAAMNAGETSILGRLIPTL